MSYEIFKNFDELQTYCNEFDMLHGSKTFFTRISMNTLRDILDKPYEDWDVQQLAKEPFVNRDIVHSNDIDVPESRIGKLNSLYLSTRAIKRGERFFAPMSVNVFPDGAVIHPGNTRLLLSKVYEWNVDVMFTDYTGTIDLRHKRIKYDPKITALHVDHGQTDDPYIPKHLKGRPYWFKQFMDHNMDSDKMSFYKPRTIDPPRRFQKKHNHIMVNETVVLRLINNQWEVVVE